MVDLVVIGVKGEKRIDIVAFSLGLGAECLALLKGSKPERKILGRRWGVRIVKQAKSDAPLGDGASGIGVQHLLKNCLRLAIPERMLVTHGAIKAPLRNLVARRFEMNGAQSLVSFFLAGDRLREWNARRDRGGSDGKC